MISFENITIEGFGSFQFPEKFEITPGLHIVKGRTGHGKTTIFSALYWALYGKNLKEVVNAKVATWEKLRTDEWRGTRVFLNWSMSDGTKYSIARHLSFKGTTKGIKGGSSLMLFKDGVLQDGALHKNDVQSAIIKIMGMDSRIFINSIIFGQRMTRLSQSSDADKRKVFDDLFELSFVPKAKEYAKEEAIKHHTKLLSCQQLISNANNTADLLQDEHDRLKQMIDSFEGDKQKDISAATKILDTYSIDLDAINANLKLKDTELKALGKIDIDTIEKDYREAEDAMEEQALEARSLARVVDNANSEIDKVQRTITNLEGDITNIDTNCPTCSAPIKKTEVNAAKKKLTAAIKTEKVVIDEIIKKKADDIKLRDKAQEELIRLTRIFEDLEKGKKNRDIYITLSNEIKVITNQLESKNSMFERQEKSIDAIKLRKLNVKKGLDVYMTEIADQNDIATAEEAKVIDYKTNFDAYNWWDKKGFSNSGIKAFVFNAMLNKLNNHIHEYTSRMGLLVRFSVDLSKASKPFKTEVWKDGILADYAELSGGQKQQLDICLAFAMFDIISNNESFNILILDELLEGLDDGVVEEVFGIIRTKITADRGIYLITHQNNIDTHASKEMFVKFDGVTSYIE